MKAKVSAIVPVYNVEMYLEECLDSIVKQTFNDIEIILVNDGSTDRSPEIMKLYASKDSRITVLNQPNSGVSAARNTGIEHASGEYILFVDSDDMIVPDAIEKLYRKADETGAELVIGNTLYCYPDGRQSALHPFSRNETLNNGSLRTGEEAYTELMKQDKFPPLIWLYFMRRDIIINNQLYFHAGIIHEDELWCVKAMLSVQKVLLLDFNYYLYRQRDGSIMHSDNYGFRIQSLFEVAKALYQYTEELQKKGISQGTVALIYVRIFYFCHSIGTLSSQKKIFDLPDLNYFSELLIKIYPALSYSQQRYCLSAFCSSQAVIKLFSPHYTN